MPYALAVPSFWLIDIVRATLTGSGDQVLTHWQRGNPKFISKKYIMEGISPGRGEIQREKSKDSFFQ